MKNWMLPILAIATAMLTGCKTVVYNPSYTRPVVINIEPRYQGKLQLYTTPSDDSFVFHGHPKSATGCAWNLKVPLGEMSKKIAGDIYGHLFEGGYAFGGVVNSSKQFVLTLHPQVKDFAWRMNQAKNLGFAITPQVKMTLDIQLLAPDSGAVIFQRQYESGWVDGSSYVISITPFESISAVIHKTMANLMVDSIRDLDATIRPNAGQPPPLPPTFSTKDAGMADVANFWEAMAAGMNAAENQKRGYQPPVYYQPPANTPNGWFEGAKIVAADGTFLGRVTKDSVSIDSIGNSVGNYGSSLSPTSIFNSIGNYGSSVATLSPWNSVTLTPPKIITGDGLYWGYLTTNAALSPRVDPSLIVAFVRSNH